MRDAAPLRPVFRILQDQMWETNLGELFRSDLRVNLTGAKHLAHLGETFLQ